VNWSNPCSLHHTSIFPKRQYSADNRFWIDFWDEGTGTAQHAILYDSQRPHSGRGTASFATQKGEPNVVVQAMNFAQLLVGKDQEEEKQKLRIKGPDALPTSEDVRDLITAINALREALPKFRVGPNGEIVMVVDK